MMQQKQQFHATLTPMNLTIQKPGACKHNNAHDDDDDDDDADDDDDDD